MSNVCFFAQFSKKPCKGIIEACHLISKQQLKRHRRTSHQPSEVCNCVNPETGRKHRELPGDPPYHCAADEQNLWDVRFLVPGCRLHHADFDHYNLEVPREAIPEGTEEIARELGLVWALDRRFGEAS